MSARIAVYAGSFDPLTNGHIWMIQQAARLFDHLTIAIGKNPDKSYTFSVPQRVALTREATRGFDNTAVDSFENRYLVDYARSIKANYIVRGIRNEHDYAFERSMRNVNDDMASEITTVFLMPPRDLCEISSSFVRGLVGPEGWQRVIQKYVPKPVFEALLERDWEVHQAEAV